MAKELIERIFELIQKDADKRREDAGYAGARDDGGASRLEEKVKYYKFGMTGHIPTEWEKYAEQARAEVDPEYAEYLRLEKKFGYLKGGNR
jgi:hypothetical protein